MKLCKRCNTEVPSDRPRQSRYCSDTCRKSGENRDYRLRTRTRVAVACQTCKGSIPESRRSDAVFCSTVCKRAKFKPIDRRNRRALKACNPGYVPITPKDWQELQRRFHGRCAYCGTAGPLTLDHVVPLARGGRHAIANALPACSFCNSSKNDMLLIEWKSKKRPDLAFPGTPR